MALTNNQKQAALRKRRAAQGLKEMRGIWASEEEETELKKMIRRRLKAMRGGNITTH